MVCRIQITITAMEKSKCLILVDNGHGFDTVGKRAPEKINGYLLKEWEWTRYVAGLVVDELNARGYNARLLVEEVNDVKISERVRRVNTRCKQLGTQNVVLVSIHCNAAGADGKWHNAQGWSAFVSSNKEGKVSKGSARLAQLLLDEALKNGRKVRREYPNLPYWVKSLGITRDTFCPAVLTENYFMDNKDDAEFLLTYAGQTECARIHVEALSKYVDEL